MAIGVVKRMHKGMVNTPHEGVLLDYTTGREYPFRRPDLAFGEVPRAWNVHTHDVVSFTITGNVATGVALYKKFQSGTVYGSFPIFGPSTYIGGRSSGHTIIIGDFGGKLRLIGSIGGGASI